MKTVKTLGCVYAAIHIESGHRYIGKSIKGLESRKAAHESQARAGRGFRFHRALRKYGCESFRWEVLFFSSDNESLLDAEFQIIGELKNSGAVLYNIKSGGQGTTHSTSEETRAKISKALTGKRLSCETREKISQSLRNMKPETRRELNLKNAERLSLPSTRESLRKGQRRRIEEGRGTKLEESARKKISKAVKNIMADPANRKKISDKLKGRKLTPEHRARVSEALKKSHARKKKMAESVGLAPNTP